MMVPELQNTNMLWVQHQEGQTPLIGPTGTAAGDTITGLNLTDGQMYFHVRVTDVAGNVSEIVSGDGILIDRYLL